MTYDSTVLKVQNTARSEEFRPSYRAIPVVLVALSSTADLPRFAALRLLTNLRLLGRRGRAANLRGRPSGDERKSLPRWGSRCGRCRADTSSGAGVPVRQGAGRDSGRGILSLR